MSAEDSECLPINKLPPEKTRGVADQNQLAIGENLANFDE
jgi:hypothetical protein